ncbi:MAG: BamA/TamA family outer membrane protein, partial [Pseudomonadota bacterium]
YGLGAFETVDYTLSSAAETTNLTIRTQEKSWGPNYVNFGIELQDDFEGSSNYNLGARYTRTAVNSLGAEWRADFQVGREPRLFSEFFQPLDHKNGFFIAPQLELSKIALNLFEDGNRIGELRINQLQAGIDFGHQFGNWGEFRIGVRRGTGSARVRIGDPTLFSLDFDSGNVFASFGYDRLDNANFPRHGTRANIEWSASRKSLGASDSFESIDADFIRAQTFSKYTLLYRMSARSNLEGDAPIQNSFSLGGLFSLSGRRNDELFGQHAGLVNVAFYRRIGGDSSSPLNTNLYLGGSLEFGNVWDDSDDISFSSGIWGGAVFLGIDTVLGPLYVAYGLTEGGETAGYFFLGPIFGEGD